MDPNSAAFSRYSRLARLLILVLLAGLGLVLGTFYFVGPALVGTGGSFSGLLHYWSGALAIWHHTLLFMAALWFLQLAAASLSKGDSADPGLPRQLTLAGSLLILGAAAWAITRPALLSSGWFATLLVEQGLNYPIASARHVDNYVAAAVVGLIGGLLVLVSRVLREQAAAASELRQIF